MGLFAIEDKTGKSELITDKDVRQMIDDLRAVEPDFEVQEYTLTEKRRFKKPVTRTEYALFYNTKVGFGQWQKLQCASGSKAKLKAYIYGYLQAHDDFRKDNP